jgi:hypothetical protein
MRVLLPHSEDCAPLRQHLDGAGVSYRSVPYWIEREEVGTVSE